LTLLGDAERVATWVAIAFGVALFITLELWLVCEGDAMTEEFADSMLSEWETEAHQ